MSTQKEDNVTIDPSSYANLAEFRTCFVDLNWEIDFENHQIHGSVTLKLKKQNPQSSPTCISLDGRRLSIRRISCLNTQNQLKFSVTTPNPKLGDKILIECGTAEQQHLQSEDEIEIQVEYSTGKSASGLKWMAASQTEGKKHPYMFSQFQAIHARSAIPCQDSPCAKAPYRATVFVDHNLVALMSAQAENESHLQKGEKISESKKDKKAFYFNQQLPTPSYLIAIVAGRLERRELSARCAVFCEAEKISACEWEFSETEKFLQTAESLITPYVWNRYDLLVLPSNFPYGGMENPSLTFVTPTLLAGDRSLANVVAHEIAHSWTGNLVTNVNWEHFWLNEGFTVFTERKIIAVLSGIEAAHLSYETGHKALVTAIEVLEKQGKNKFTSLVHDLQDEDPDDAFSRVPYERGAQFLFHLEHLVGENEFSNFFREWVKTYQFKNVDSNTFRQFFVKYFPSVAQKVEWEAWLYGKGLPPVAISELLNLGAAKKALALSKQWREKQGEGASLSDIQDWHNSVFLYFLGDLKENGPLPLPVLEGLTKEYKLSDSQNSEVLFLWSQLAIQSEYTQVFPLIVKFITSQGRMKFVRPLFRALFACPAGKQLALETFKTHKAFYHPIAQKMLSSDLGLADD